MSDSIKLAKRLYTTGFGVVADRWFKGSDSIDMRGSIPDVLRERLAAAEALMIAPSVTFYVWGENVVLPLLTAAFGPENVADMLQDRSIKFHLYSGSIATTDDRDMLKQGVLPLLQCGRPTNPEHGNPEVSAKKGLTIWGETQKIERGLRRRLVRLASESTVQTPDWVPAFIMQRIQAAYEMGELEPLGFKADVPMNELSSKQILQLGTIGERLARTVDMLENSYDLYQSAELWETLEALYAKIEVSDKTRGISTEILALHNLPSIPTLLAGGVIQLRDVPRLRRLPEVESYRRWLWGQRDPSAAADVKQAYIAALDRHVQVTDKRWYKAANLTTMTGVGFYLGLMTSPLGAIAGGLAGSIASTGISAAVDSIAVKLSKKPDPQQFATIIGNVYAKSKGQATPTN